MKQTSNDLENSLIVMDIADRMDRENRVIDEAARVDESRSAMKQRIQGFYRSQGKEVDGRIIDQAIEQRINSRLVHQPAGGLSARLADGAIVLAQSTGATLGFVMGAVALVAAAAGAIGMETVHLVLFIL